MLIKPAVHGGRVSRADCKLRQRKEWLLSSLGADKLESSHRTVEGAGAACCCGRGMFTTPWLLRKCKNTAIGSSPQACRVPLHPWPWPLPATLTPYSQQFFWAQKLCLCRPCEGHLNLKKQVLKYWQLPKREEMGKWRLCCRTSR